MPTPETAAETIAVDFSGFPAAAEHAGDTWRIFVEPVAGSGERILAGVLARLDNADISMVSALNPTTLKCVFGADGKFLLAHAQATLQDALNTLKSEATLKGWAPKCEGFEVAEPLRGFADTAAELARSEIMQGACFAMRRGEFDLDDEQAAETNAADTIKQTVVSRRKPLSKHFNRKFDPFNHGRKIRVYFSAPRIIANFSRFMPGKVSYSEERAQLRMMNLLALRDGLFSDHDAEQFQMLVLAPDYDEKLFSSRQNRDYQAARASLLDLGDKERVRVRFMPTAESTADYILKMAPA